MKKKIFITIVLVISIISCFSVKTHAVETKIEQKSFMKNSSVVEEKTEDKKEKKVQSKSFGVFYRVKSLKGLLGEVANEKSKFNLAEKINIPVKNQMNTQECWAFSLYSSMESNLLYKQNIVEDFSERHMNYATSSSFSDKKIEELDYTREASYGGKPEIGLAYLTNGQGTVFENQMPFKDDMGKIPYNSINIKPTYYVDDYIEFPNIIKVYDANRNVTYTDAYGTPIDEQFVKNTRTKIKNYIKEYGAVTSVTAAACLDAYSNTENPMLSTSFCCLDSSYQRDHAVTIVGWDDTYSKENFNEKSRPKSDGAYIVLQSYSDKTFNNGYMYVSYEDTLIETSVYGIKHSLKYDYDKIYQNNYYGTNGVLKLENYESGYIASIYDRDSSKYETLTKVSFNIAEEANVEIYVNGTSGDVDSKLLMKVGQSNGALDAGYHTIDITDTILKSDKFVIAMKIIPTNKKFSFPIEFKADDILYNNVKAKANTNFLSIDGKNWENLLNTSPDESIKTVDFCIKGFTKELSSIPEEKEDKEPLQPKDENKGIREVSFGEYKVDKDNFIYDIKPNTTVETFVKSVKMTEDGKEVTINHDKYKDSLKDLVTTGMTYEINGKKYTLIVKGDINGDGKISLIDLSKLTAHYAEIKGSELTGNALKGADMNLDGKVSLIDLSKLLEIYVNM